MIRQFHTKRIRELEGHQRSHELANALAQITDPDTMEKLLHVVTLLQSVGGQAFVVAVRNKYDARTYERVEPGHEGPVVHETDGYIFHYEHIATALRGAEREPDAQKRPFEAPPEPVAEEELTPEQEAELAKLVEQTVGADHD